jgi:hypothetical protein
VVVLTARDEQSEAEPQAKDAVLEQRLESKFEFPLAVVKRVFIVQ